MIVGNLLVLGQGGVLESFHFGLKLLVESVQSLVFPLILFGRFGEFNFRVFLEFIDFAILIPE